MKCYLYDGWGGTYVYSEIEDGVEEPQYEGGYYPDIIITGLNNDDIVNDEEIMDLIDYLSSSYSHERVNYTVDYVSDTDARYSKDKPTIVTTFDELDKAVSDPTSVADLIQINYKDLEKILAKFYTLVENWFNLK